MTKTDLATKAMGPGKRMFFVAISKQRPGCGGAACHDDSEDKQTKGRGVREFFKEYAGREIRYVDGDEMKRLMTMEPSDAAKAGKLI